MIIIISLKKLTASQKSEIRKHYSIIQFDENHHSSKKIASLGNADLMWFDMTPSMINGLNTNKTFKYILNAVDQLIDPKVVVVYDREKYRKLLNPINKVVNFFIKTFPPLKKANLESTLLRISKNENKSPEIPIKTPEKNLLLQEDTETNVFEDLDEIIEEIKNQNNKLRESLKDAEEKNKKLVDEISSLHVECTTLKEQVSSLKDEVKDLEITLPRPTLVRQPCEKHQEEKKEIKEEIKITDKNNSLVVTSNISGVIETVIYRTMRDRRKKLIKLQQKYQKISKKSI